ncbi:MAG TPA: hypothetical protein VHV99_00370 [Paraburkholderia sp.]|nr:hypothetical protein [Paraburkholderia sp.]
METGGWPKRYSPGDRNDHDIDHDFDIDIDIDHDDVAAERRPELIHAGTAPKP